MAEIDSTEIIRQLIAVSRDNIHALAALKSGVDTMLERLLSTGKIEFETIKMIVTSVQSRMDSQKDFSVILETIHLDFDSTKSTIAKLEESSRISLEKLELAINGYTKAIETKDIEGSKFKWQIAASFAAGVIIPVVGMVVKWLLSPATPLK